MKNFHWKSNFFYWKFQRLLVRVLFCLFGRTISEENSSKQYGQHSPFFKIWCSQSSLAHFSALLKQTRSPLLHEQCKQSLAFQLDMCGLILLSKSTHDQYLFDNADIFVCKKFDFSLPFKAGTLQRGQQLFFLSKIGLAQVTGGHWFISHITKPFRHVQWVHASNFQLSFSKWIFLSLGEMQMLVFLALTFFSSSSST